MLRSDIHQFVSSSSCKLLEDMIARAREKEIDLEMERKRKLEVASGVVGSGKSPRCLITALGGSRATFIVEIVAGCTMGCARQRVPAASSAVGLGI